MTSAEELAYQRQNILLDMASRCLPPVEYINLYNRGQAATQERIGHLSLATLYRWQKGYKEGGIKGLSPRYNRSTCARGLNTEVKELIQAYYLDENRPTLAHILRLIKRYH